MVIACTRWVAASSRRPSAQHLGHVDVAIGVAAVQGKRIVHELACCIEPAELERDHAHEMQGVRIVAVDHQQFAAEPFGLLQFARAKMLYGRGEQPGFAACRAGRGRACSLLLCGPAFLAVHGRITQASAAASRAACSLSTSGASLTLAGGLSAIPSLRGITCT